MVKKKKIEDTGYKAPVLPEDVDELKAYALKVHSQLHEMTERRNNLSGWCKKLGEDLDALCDGTEEQREREAHDLRIRQKWNSTMKEAARTLKIAMHEMPLPSETHVFMSEEWEKIPEIEALIQRFLVELQQVKNTRFIEPGQA